MEPILQSVSWRNAGSPVDPIAFMNDLSHLKSSLLLVTNGAFLLIEMIINNKASVSLDITVANAPPKTPNRGNGPSPKIKRALRTALRKREKIVVYMGVFASPIALKAPLYIIEKPTKI